MPVSLVHQHSKVRKCPMTFKYGQIAISLLMNPNEEQKLLIKAAQS